MDLSGLLRGGLDWLLPPRCGGCGALGTWLCLRCRRDIEAPRWPRCERCGHELEFVGAGCGCHRHLRALSRLRSAALYEGPLERAIHRFKYEGWRALGPTLAELLVEPGRDRPPGAWVVAVPLHPARRRRRGYDQAEILAAHLRRRCRAPAPPGRLVRLRDTPPQVGQDRLRRRANVASAFAWRGAPLAGAPVVVVDDVATTGATLEACARALRAAGAGSVQGLTLARAGGRW
ncbi:MAG TPA: double zinc ribbon domain-containing protein [Candidatus Dormibacteraeota bacterium]|nr:double zinc ribbon domain-containing protein [Candidatus Dormibacteraeota bacterium]